MSGGLARVAWLGPVVPALREAPTVRLRTVNAADQDRLAREHLARYVLAYAERFGVVPSATPEYRANAPRTAP